MGSGSLIQMKFFICPCKSAAWKFQLKEPVRAGCKPSRNPLSFCSSPTKASLYGTVLFTLQQTHWLPISEANLIFFFTMFMIVCKVSLQQLCCQQMTEPKLEILTFLSHYRIHCRICSGNSMLNSPSHKQLLVLAAGAFSGVTRMLSGQDFLALCDL